jgi:hypothetical protein
MGFVETKHCKYGHEWTVANTGWKPRAGKQAKRRFCRACANRVGQEHRARLAASRGPRPPKEPKVPRVKGPAWLTDTHDRFFARVRMLPLETEVRPRLGPCWVWTGPKINGYGKASAGGKTWRAHRLAWVLYGNPLQDAMVTHRCDNRLCVRRSHLRLGTHEMNTTEAFARGRLQPKNVLHLPPADVRERFYARDPHCSRGHAMAPANTRWRFRDEKGWLKECRRCHAIAAREWGKRKRKAARG